MEGVPLHLNRLVSAVHTSCERGAAIRSRLELKLLVACAVVPIHQEGPVVPGQAAVHRDKVEGAGSCRHNGVGCRWPSGHASYPAYRPCAQSGCKASPPKACAVSVRHGDTGNANKAHRVSVILVASCQKTKSRTASVAALWPSPGLPGLDGCRRSCRGCSGTIRRLHACMPPATRSGSVAGKAKAHATAGAAAQLCI